MDSGIYLALIATHHRPQRNGKPARHLPQIACGIIEILRPPEQDAHSVKTECSAPFVGGRMMNLGVAAIVAKHEHLPRFRKPRRVVPFGKPNAFDAFHRIHPFGKRDALAVIRHLRVAGNVNHVRQAQILIVSRPAS